MRGEVAPSAVRRGASPHGRPPAALLRAGVAVVSQRDHRTLGHLRARLDPAFQPDPEARDHHETDWYREAFPGAAPDGRAT